MWIFKAVILFTAGFLVASGASMDWTETDNSLLEYYLSTKSVNKSLAEESCQERNASLVGYTDFAALPFMNHTTWVKGNEKCTAVNKSSGTLENITLPCNASARYVCIRPANMTWGEWGHWSECSSVERCRRRQMIIYESNWTEYMVHHRPWVSNMTETTTEVIVKSTDPISSTAASQTTADSITTTTSSTTDDITTASTTSADVTTSATTTKSITETTECSTERWWKFDAGSFFVGAPVFFLFLVILAVKHYHLLEEMRATHEELDYMKEGRRDLPNELNTRSKLRFAALNPGKKIPRKNSRDESACEVPNRTTPFYENVTNANDGVIVENKPPVHTTTHVNATFSRGESLGSPDYENVDETGSCHNSLLLDEDVGYIDPTTIPRKHDTCEDYDDLDTTPEDPRNESTDKPDHVYVNVTSTSKGFVKIPRFVSVMKAKVALRPPKSWRHESKSHITSRDKNVKPPLKPVNNKKDKNTPSHQSLGLALKPPKNQQPGNALPTTSTGENANPKAALKPVNNKKEKNTASHQSLGLALKPPKNQQSGSALPTTSGENANPKSALKPVNNNKEKTSTGHQNDDFKKVKAALKPTANAKPQGIKSADQRKPSFENIVDAKNALTPVKNT